MSKDGDMKYYERVARENDLTHSVRSVARCSPRRILSRARRSYAM